MDISIMGAVMMVYGIILATLGVQRLRRFRKSRQLPRRASLIYWHTWGGLATALLGLLLLVVRLIPAAIPPGYAGVAGLSLCCLLLFIAFQSWRESSRTKKAKKAIEFLEGQIMITGDSWELLNQLGFFYREISELEKSKEVLMRAITMAPNEMPPHLNLGNTYLDLGRCREALAEYNKAKELSPQDSRIDANIALVLKRMTD